MKNKKIVIAFFSLIGIFLLIGFFIIYNKVQLNKLKLEIENISTYEINSKDIISDVRCTGGYGVVEATIKDYLNNYSKEINNINNIMKDEEFKILLTADNYKKDSPEFNKSLNYIKDKNNKFNKSIDNLIKYSNEEYILNLIEDNTRNKKYISLYKDLVKQNLIIDKTTKYKNDFIIYKKKYNDKFNSMKSIIILIKNNYKYLKFDNDVVKFPNRDLLNQYNYHFSIING